MVNCHFHGSIDIPTKCHPGWRHTPALFEESPFLLAQRNTIWLCPEWGYTFSREIQVIYLRVSGSLYPLYPFAAFKTRNSEMSY